MSVSYCVTMTVVLALQEVLALRVAESLVLPAFLPVSLPLVVTVAIEVDLTL